MGSSCLLSAGTGTGGRPPFKRCTQVQDLLHQVAELQEVERRLCNIREAEKEFTESQDVRVWKGHQKII